MFKAGLILLIISSMLIPAVVFAGGIELHSEPGVCPGDPAGGGELGPANTPDELTPSVKLTFILLPVPSSSGFVYNPTLIPVVVKQDDFLKNTELQISYFSHRQEGL